MRIVVAMLFVCQMLPTTSARAENQFPYKAVVISEDAFARSGPGQDYYATEPLRRGQEIEVYRHNSDGWCAIRPVDSSFTWVPSRFLRHKEDRLAVVLDEGVAARVGSRVNNSQDVVQVRLHQGEIVEVLEAPRGSWDDSDGWCKIAPPSGEFRWVAAQDIADSPGSRTADAQKADGRELSPGEAIQSRLAESRGVSPDAFREEVERLEFNLSVTVADNPNSWSFDALRERANVLLSAAQTPSERGRVRLLVDRIDQFDDIRQRQTQMLAQKEQVDRAGRFLARAYPGGNRDAAQSSNVAYAGSASARFQTDGRFDGTGRLIQVQAAKPGAPHYALVNDSGDILCYVTAAPGVNLYAYLDRRIGLIGTRGYMPEQKATHIMAKHITALDGQNMLR